MGPRGRLIDVLTASGARRGWGPAPAPSVGYDGGALDSGGVHAAIEGTNHMTRPRTTIAVATLSAGAIHLRGHGSLAARTGRPGYGHANHVQPPSTQVADGFRF